MDGLPGPLKPLNFNWEAEKPKREHKLLPVAAPKKLRPRLRIVLQLLESGLTQREISKLTGYTEVRVSQISRMQDPRIKAIRKAAKETIDNSIVDIAAKFRNYANEALDRQVDLMRQTDDKPTARLASKFILEVAGYTPVRKQANITATVPQDEFIAAVQRMDKTDEVERRAQEWAYQPPVKVVPKPE